MSLSKEEIEEQRLEAEGLLENGIWLRNRGEYESALIDFKQALAINTRIGHRMNQAYSFWNIGRLHHEISQYQEASSAFHQALEIYREIGDKKFEEECLENLGCIYNEMGEHQEAIFYFTMTLELARQSGNKEHEQHWLVNLGNVYQNSGNYKRATEHLQLALEISKELEMRSLEGILSGRIGQLLIWLKQWNEAEDYLKKAIEICDGVSFQFVNNRYRSFLALIYAHQDQLEEAFQILGEIEPFFPSYPMEYGKFLCIKAKIFQLNEQNPEAVQAFSQAKKIAEDIEATEDSELSKEIRETEVFLQEHWWVLKKE